MRALASISLLAVLLVACGDDGGGTNTNQDAAPVDTSTPVDVAIDTPVGGTFAITSPAFVEGAMIPTANACAGANTSPQLDWTNPPAGTMSYAIVFTDLSNMLIHWVIYDIPASATGLPADVDKMYAPPDVPGAHQTTSYQAATRGYLGPCPPNTHTYQFKIFAINAATLPGATMNTTRQQASLIINQNMLGSATLTGMYTP